MKCNTCGGSFAGFEECPVCQPSIKQRHMNYTREQIVKGMFTNEQSGALAHDIIQLYNLIDIQQKTIRLLREAAQELYDGFMAGKDMETLSDKQTMRKYRELIKQLDEQEAEK